MEYLGFLVLGAGVGTIGTLIGAGGGFLLTPILLLFFPSLSPSTVTAISMMTIFFNSSSGTFAYSRMKRIDYKTGIIFAVATLPGSVLGTLATGLLPRAVFNTVFGAFMLVFAGVIVLKSRMGDHSAPPEQAGLFRAVRRLTDRDGHTTAFSFNMLAGFLLSLGVGFLSGLLGIGGGIIHVPALVFLGFPTHFATATSHFVLVFSSLTSLGVHLTDGSLNPALWMALTIAVGAVFGAQIGARISKKLKGSVILLCLAGALVIAGLRILYMGIRGLIG